MVVLTSVILLAGETPALAAEAQKTCLNLTQTRSQATVSGMLTVHLFSGPPNYESIAKGDAEERTFILELPSRLCADDGEFIRPNASFDRVHVGASDDVILSVLKAAIGKTVTVRGEAFGAHTGHHHAPLVLMANQVTVASGAR